MPTIKLITLINAPKQRCFDLSRSIDLHKHSTAHTQEQAVSGATSGLIKMGEKVTWRAKHFGIFQHLTSKITAFDSPHYFQDTMVKGAFKSIIHDHFFAEDGAVTVMRDELIFESPLGILGKIANVLVLQRYLLKLLERRNLTIKQVAESEEWKKFL